MPCVTVDQGHLDCHGTKSFAVYCAGWYCGRVPSSIDDDWPPPTQEDVHRLCGWKLRALYNWKVPAFLFTCSGLCSCHHSYVQDLVALPPVLNWILYHFKKSVVCVHEGKLWFWCPLRLLNHSHTCLSIYHIELNAKKTTGKNRGTMI